MFKRLGAKCYSKPDTLHNRIIRYFLGVHKCTLNAVIQGDMGWILPHIRRQLNCLRLSNRLLDLDANRITKRTFVWDYTINKLNCRRDVNNILKGIDLRHKFEIALTYSHAAKTSVDLAKQLLMEKFRIKWSNDVMSQNKLEVYTTS